MAKSGICILEIIFITFPEEELVQTYKGFDGWYKNEEK